MATWPEFKLPPVNLYSIGAYHGIKSMAEEKVMPREQVEAQRTQDPGIHYRYSRTVILTQNDIDRGSVTINLDPFRIADIYGMTNFALMTILKKCLCAGNRGHKGLVQDLRDIICAANRMLQMLEEDGRV
jgi:hypothetical protein